MQNDFSDGKLCEVPISVFVTNASGPVTPSPQPITLSENSGTEDAPGLGEADAGESTADTEVAVSEGVAEDIAEIAEKPLPQLVEVDSIEVKLGPGERRKVRAPGVPFR